MRQASIFSNDQLSIIRSESAIRKTIDQNQVSRLKASVGDSFITRHSKVLAGEHIEVLK